MCADVLQVKEAVNNRYAALADSSCCLSCGGALDLAQPQKGEICVDLGSGRGAEALRLADATGSDGHVYGIDITDDMLRKARSTAKKLGYSNVTFVQADLEKIPLKTDSVDLVISNCTINHAGDKDAVWHEIARILKPGGRFVVSDIYATQPVPERYARDPEAVAQCWAGATEKNTYLRVLEQAGFAHIEILEESDAYPKGAIEVCSFTVTGTAPSGCCCQNPTSPKEYSA